MVSKRKTIISIILIITLVSSTFAYEANATDWVAAAKWAADIAAKVAAQVAYKIIANKIIAKVQNGGADGKSAFIKNWINFETNAQYQGEGIFRGELTTAKLCDYFSKSLKSAFGVKSTDSINLAGQNVRTDDLESYGLKTACTLSKNFDLSKYQKDFAGNGGWQAFSRMLEPQNNYYGSLFQSLDEVAKQRALSEKSAIDNAKAGSGFTGLQDACKKIGLGDKCLIQSDVKTPGVVLKDNVSNALNSVTSFLSSADSASIAITTLTTWAVTKLFDLGGSDNSEDNAKVTTTYDESYKNEFCTAKDNMSNEAANYINTKYPQAYKDFPPGGSSGPFGLVPFNGSHSYCEQFRSDDNHYPFERCSQACFKAVGLTDVNVPTFSETPPPTPTPTNTDTCKTDPNSCPSPPEDALTKHPDRTSVVSSVKADLVAQGVNLSNCGAFEITKRVAWELKGESAGLLKKPGGSNCQGFATDIIAYPDGYIYDTLGDGGGANNPQWNPDACGTVATGGICPERYEPAFAP